MSGIRKLNLWAGSIAILSSVLMITSFIVIIGAGVKAVADGEVSDLAAGIGATGLVLMLFAIPLGIATLVLGIMQVIKKSDSSNENLTLAAGILNIIGIGIIGGILSLVAASADK